MKRLQKRSIPYTRQKVRGRITSTCTVSKDVHLKTFRTLYLKAFEFL